MPEAAMPEAAMLELPEPETQSVAVVEEAMGVIAAAAEKIASLWFPCSQKLALAPRMTA
jgi:hypothetical protein